jgi:hypothetical protein
MTQEAFARGVWQSVIDAHRLKNHDPAEWQHYGSGLLHAIQPGLEAGNQRQRLSWLFVQAQKEGANAGAVVVAQRQMARANLRQFLEMVGVPASTNPELRSAGAAGARDAPCPSALAGLLCQQGSQAPTQLDGSDAYNPTGYRKPLQAVVKS